MKDKKLKALLQSIQPTVDQEIAEIGLNRLKEVAMARQLSPEEVKMLETYSKVVRVAKGEATDIVLNQYDKLEQKNTSIPEAELIKVAEQKLIGDHADKQKAAQSDDE